MTLNNDVVQSSRPTPPLAPQVPPFPSCLVAEAEKGLSSKAAEEAEDSEELQVPYGSGTSLLGFRV